jgi:hypothetical protein
MPQSQPLTGISGPGQHKTNFVLRRLFFIQPSLDPLHCISIRTPWVWARPIGVIGHALKWIAALALLGK